MLINANLNPQRSFETWRNTKKSEKERKTLAKKKKVMKDWPPSKKHFDEKMRMTFLIAHSFLLEIEITEKKKQHRKL
jgi:hypothetical protein